MGAQQSIEIIRFHFTTYHLTVGSYVLCLVDLTVESGLRRGVKPSVLGISWCLLAKGESSTHAC
jgi:hypothetical protein